MSHARLIAKAPASSKARVVHSTQRGLHGTVAAPKVIPATKSTKAKPVAPGGPAKRV